MRWRFVFPPPKLPYISQAPHLSMSLTHTHQQGAKWVCTKALRAHVGYVSSPPLHCPTLPYISRALHLSMSLTRTHQEQAKRESTKASRALVGHLSCPLLEEPWQIPLRYVCFFLLFLFTRACLECNRALVGIWQGSFCIWIQKEFCHMPKRPLVNTQRALLNSKKA